MPNITSKAAAHLISAGHVYRDYSTEGERAAEKTAAERAKRAYRFRRKELSSEEAAKLEAEGRPYALRFQVPPGRTLVLQDLIKGDVEFSTDEISDFVIVRPDGTPLYNFASVVDDAAMEITHVVRADEHLSNTFPQLLVFEALGAKLPEFAHVPFVAEHGSKAKMSKRKLAEYEKQGVLVYLHQYIERGYLPDAVVNYLARLGWSYDASQEIFARAELIEKFTLEKVNSSPASHDQDKLFWIEGEWMKTLPLAQKVAGVVPFLESEGLVKQPLDAAEQARIEAVIRALGDRLKVFSDILKLGRYFFSRGDDIRAGRREETAAKRGCRGDAQGAWRFARRGPAIRPRDAREIGSRVCRAHRPEDGRRGKPAASGRDGAGGWAGALRLPGDPGARHLPESDCADGRDARREGPRGIAGESKVNDRHVATVTFTAN